MGACCATALLACGLASMRNAEQTQFSPSRLSNPTEAQNLVKLQMEHAGLGCSPSAGGSGTYVPPSAAHRRRTASRRRLPEQRRYCGCCCCSVKQRARQCRRTALRPVLRFEQIYSHALRMSSWIKFAGAQRTVICWRSPKQDNAP